MNINQAVALLGIADRVEDIDTVETPAGEVGFARMGATQVVVMPIGDNPMVNERGFAATVHTHDDVNDAIECQAHAIRMIRADVADYMAREVYGDASVARSQLGFGFGPMV